MKIRKTTITAIVIILTAILVNGPHHNSTVMGTETLEITSDFVFTEDLVVSSGHGLVIGADNITIDGSGFCLDGVSPGPCDGGVVTHCGIINTGHDNITIKNLEIKNFCSGIFLTYDASSGDIAYRNVIENCHVHHNGNDKSEWTESHGIKMIGVSDSIVRDCTVHDNKGAGTACEDGGNGIFLMGTSSGDGGKRNRITNNLIYNSTKGGFFTKQKPQYTQVDNNTIYGNGQGGIILRCKLSNNHIIENNTVTKNYGCGMFIGGSENCIQYNVITNNKNGSAYTGIVGEYGTGVDFGRSDGSRNNSLLHNTICGNEVVDVEAFDINENTGNWGNYNTGEGALKYHDESPQANQWFTFSCSELSDKSTVNKVITDTETPGYESLSVFLSIGITLILISYQGKKKR